MVTVLGIHPGHDASAALIRDGKILAAVDEERFRRRKHWGGGYPHKSVEFVLDYCKLKIEEVDYIAIPARKFSKKELVSLGLRYLKYPSVFASRFKKRVGGDIGFELHSRVILRGLKEHFGNVVVKIIGVDHHTAHAASAYYTSKFEDPAVLTLDGVGGAISGTVSVIKDRKIKRISSSLEPGSLGHFYEALTEALGFLINNGEYKVMGMAAYGDWTKGGYRELKNLAPRLKGLQFVRRKSWEIKSNYRDHFWKVHIKESEYVKRLIEKYGHLNVAAAGQRVLEDLILDWVKNVMEETGKEEFCVAGGVFLNIKANKRIRDELGVKIYAFPHAGDGGLSAGSALYVNALADKSCEFEKLKTLSLGPEYNNEEILEVLEKSGKIRYRKVKDISKEAARYVSNGKIVGWFQGRMEYGPRALGNRSILTSSAKKEYSDKVNIKIKFREKWRPFCPSMTSRGKKYLVNAEDDAYFMVTSFGVPREKIGDIEGVVHVDETTRPQIVTPKVNKRFYELIKEVERLTKVAVVLNTSFNVRGEPIVCSPQDALNNFLNCGMEYLAIGDYWVRKK